MNILVMLVASLMLVAALFAAIVAVRLRDVRDDNDEAASGYNFLRLLALVGVFLGVVGVVIGSQYPFEPSALAWNGVYGLITLPILVLTIRLSWEGWKLLQRLLPTRRHDGH
jgi:amino acid transporter